MKYLIYPCLISYILFISCTNNYLVKREPISSTYEKKINYLGERRTGKIFLKNGNIILADKIRIIQNELEYINHKTLVDSSIAISDISKISFKDRVIGFTYGFYIGLGTAIIFLASQLSESNEPVSFYAIGGSFIIGGLLFGIPGAIVGSNLNYTFIDSSQ
jgi:hypothetical protein